METLSDGVYAHQAALSFGSLNDPRGVAVDDLSPTHPDVFVLDAQPSPGTPKLVELPNGAGTQVTLPIGALSTKAGQIAADDGGDVFVADDGNQRVVELAHGASAPTVLPIAGLQGADGITVSGQTVLVADETAKNVVKFNLADNSQSLVALPTGVVPGDLSFDSLGNLYVFDNAAKDVVRVSSGGQATVLSLPGASQPAAGMAATVQGGAVFVSNAIDFKISEHVTTKDPAPTITSPDFDDAFGHVSAPIAVNDPNNLQILITYNPNDTPVPADFLGLVGISSNESVLPSNDISIKRVGITNSYTVSFHPIARGSATVTIVGAESPGQPTESLLGTLTIVVGVASQPPDSTVRYLLGAANASSVLGVGDGYFLDADDDTSPLRLYQGGTTGYPVGQWDFSSDFGGGKLDFEALARHGNDVFAADSFSAGVGNSPIVDYGTSGSGANTDLSYRGVYFGLEQDLIDWDNGNGAPLGIAASARFSQKDSDGDGLALKGIEFAPDNTTAYVAMRVPLEPTSGPNARTEALIVPVTNFTKLFNDDGTHAQFGPPILMNLGGVGIREIRKNADSQYLILTGPPGDSGSNTAPQQALWEWDGVPADAPVQLTTDIMTGEPFLGGSSAWEGIEDAPDPLLQGSQVTLIQDDGKATPTGQGSQKGFAGNDQRAASDVFAVDFGQAENANRPSIGGTAIVDNTLSCDPGTWTGRRRSPSSGCGTAARPPLKRYRLQAR